MIRALVSTFIFFAISGWAKNNPISTAVNQIEMGGGCDLPLACGPQNQYKNRRFQSAQQIVEWNTFQKAAEIQFNKDQCFLDQALTVTNDQSAKDYVLISLSRVWLSYKKTELIIGICEKIQNEKLISKNQPSRIARKKFDPKWEAFCNDAGKLQPLLASKELFKIALPFLQSQDAIDLMEKWRQNITIKKTGKALSDADLLQMKIYSFQLATDNPDSAETIAYNQAVKLDVENAKSKAEDRKELNQFSLNFKITKGLENDYTALFKKLYDQRKASLEKLARTKNNVSGVYNLDDSLKDYIYEEGSLKEALETSEMADTVVGKCIMSQYEPTMVGELATFGVESAVVGGVVFTTVGRIAASTKLARLVGLGKDVSTISKAKRSFMLGAGLTGVKEGVAQFSKCMGSPVKISKDYRRKIALPSEIGFKGFEMGTDDSSTPACKATNTPNLLLSEASTAYCVEEGLLNFLPLAVALPATFLIGD